MAKIDLEQLKLMKELMGNTTTQTAIPTVQVATDRRSSDSFAATGSFLRSNWPIIVTLVGAILYIPGQFNSIESIDKAQDLLIQQHAEEIKVLVTSLRQTQDSQSVQNSEIVRKLDKLQTDIEAIKEKQK